MLHLKKNSRGKYYWLSIKTKANTFEEIGKCSQYHDFKEDAIESIKHEAEIFGFPQVLYVVDHEQTRYPQKVVVFKLILVGQKYLKEVIKDWDNHHDKQQEREIKFALK
jgi:hypothetical protein